MPTTALAATATTARATTAGRDSGCDGRQVSSHKCGNCNCNQLELH